jgi:adenosylmethionine-8-amino-7-oxononanoate aminotransferase
MMSSSSNSGGSFYSSNNIATATAIASLTAMNEIQTIAQHVEAKTNYLMSLKEGIENMPVVHQIEVLRILCSKNTQINENKNGVFVNISRLNNDLIQELYDYMKYFINQENHLNEIEQQKQSLTKEFFDK